MTLAPDIYPQREAPKRVFVKEFSVFKEWRIDKSRDEEAMATIEF